MKYKIQINTNLPSLIVTIWNNDNIVATNKNVTKIKDKDVEKLFLEIEQGLYTMRLSLPYHNPSNEKNGELFEMPILMESFISMNRNVCYDFFAKLQESEENDLSTDDEVTHNVFFGENIKRIINN